MARENLCRNPSFAYLLREWAKIAPATVRIGSDTGLRAGTLPVSAVSGHRRAARCAGSGYRADGRSHCLVADRRDLGARARPRLLAVAVSPEWTAWAAAASRETPGAVGRQRGWG